MKNLGLLGIGGTKHAALLRWQNAFYIVNPPYNKANAKRIVIIEDKRIHTRKNFRDWKDFQLYCLENYYASACSLIGAEAYKEFIKSGGVKSSNLKKAIFKKLDCLFDKNQKTMLATALYATGLMNKEGYSSVCKEKNLIEQSFDLQINNYNIQEFIKKFLDDIDKQSSSIEDLEKSQSITFFIKIFYSDIIPGISDAYSKISKKLRAEYAKSNSKTRKSWQSSSKTKIFIKGGLR